MSLMCPRDSVREREFDRTSNFSLCVQCSVGYAVCKVALELKSSHINTREQERNELTLKHTQTSTRTHLSQSSYFLQTHTDTQTHTQSHALTSRSRRVFSIAFSDCSAPFFVINRPAALTATLPISPCHNVKKTGDCEDVCECVCVCVG
jgi:hypothetical protein